MTTKKKTLKEAAVDILQASAKTDQEPMHKGPEVDNNDPSGAVVDLGGSTTEDPSGGPVGQKASAARSQMAPPKIGKNAAAEAMHAGPEDKGAASAASTEGEE
ncbi:MAG: hypothetical protein ACREQ5_09670, partial [Candidatus Dormibacteria bacterium]